MKAALFLLAFTTSVVAQTPTPPSTPPQTSAPAQTPAQTPTTPPTPPTAVQPGATPTPPQGTLSRPPLAPPPPMEKPEDHNGPAYKNPKSTIPKVVGLPHVLYSLKYIDTKIGTGPVAEPHKFFTVNYTGWFTDGTKFDSSFDHTPKEPITFPYGAQRVIIGWDTGFEGMRVGGKRRLYVPYQLAYGLLGRPPKMGPKANLIFDVELVGQTDKPPAPPAGSRQPGRPMPGTPGAPGIVRPGAPVTPPASAAPSAPATPGTPPATATPAPSQSTPSPSTPLPAKPTTPPTP